MGAMACRLTLGKKGYEEVQVLMKEKSERLDRLREELARLIDEDADAYAKVMGAFKLPKETEEEKVIRADAVQMALRSAAEVPLRTATLCREVIDDLLLIAPACNRNAASDAAVALGSALNGLQGASLNVEANLAAIKDADYQAHALAKLNHLLGDTETKVRDAIAAMRAKM